MQTTQAIPYRIALLTSFPPDVTVGSGVVRMIIGYAKALRQVGLQAEIVHPTFKPTSYLNLAVRRLTFNKKLKLADYDLLIGSDFDGFAFAAGSMPKIVLNGGILADIVRFENGPTRRILEHLSKRECQNVRSALRVVVPSAYTARKVRQYYGVSPERIAVIPLAIDRDYWQNLLHHAKEEFSRPPTILCVAKQYRRKGIADLIRAFSLVRKKVSQVRLRLVGNGPEFDNNRALAQKLTLGNTVEFVGDVADDTRLAAYYRNADIFCLPSYHETFGFVFLEAMVAGLPVVAYRTTAVPEVVPEEAGLLLEAGNIDRLAENLVTLLFDVRQRQERARAGQRSAEKFSWQVAGLRLASLIGAVQN